ncbi:unnamed protein product [Medioppia subpectinata]|uniref:Uncharacterized protein n=1 Tax=Medioppia subpectinata TaxID=1979941 RepID=A0A7R9L4C1_9ACAR|nr:unnamed protein product [Medioppia subpectinata]CAG2114165.1 unnamed protein product [Medioppia subpectinata]
MMSFVAFVSFTVISLTGVAKGVPFCDTKSMDNVYSVGHLVYMTRCGEVWTYDPRMDDGLSGFTKDYAFYTLARRYFGPNLHEWAGRQWDEQMKREFRFAVWSFQELDCTDSIETIDSVCAQAVEAWNGYTAMVDNHTGIFFRYRGEFENIGKWVDGKDPMGIGWTIGMEAIATTVRTNWWPKIDKLTSHDLAFDFSSTIHAALFVKNENRLYMALLSANTKYYCVTHLNMDKELHNVTKLPVSGILSKYPNWAEGYCFTGILVGMFFDEKMNKAYIVGQVLYERRWFEDQIYEMTATDGQKVIITEVEENQYPGVPKSLRSYFGCGISEEAVDEAKEQRDKHIIKRSIIEDTHNGINYYLDVCVKRFGEEFVQYFLIGVSFLLFLSIVRNVWVIYLNSAKVSDKKT